MKLPKKCIVDTNVPLTSNLIKYPDPNSDIDNGSILKCIDAIEQVKEGNALVLDSEDEIFDQYRQSFSKHIQDRYGNLGSGDYFYLWVRDYRFSFPKEDMVKVVKSGDSYVEFPQNKELQNFDPSDRIFIAIANKHKDRPPVLQGTDSKWWGYREIFEAIGIKIIFLCPEYVERIYNRKQKDKREKND
jgi:hypothetical protein